jgi:hypothetical protein
LIGKDLLLSFCNLFSDCFVGPFFLSSCLLLSFYGFGDFTPSLPKFYEFDVKILLFFTFMSLNNLLQLWLLLMVLFFNSSSRNKIASCTAKNAKDDYLLLMPLCFLIFIMLLLIRSLCFNLTLLAIPTKQS